MQHTIITVTIEMDDNTNIVDAARVAKYATINVLSGLTKCINTTINSLEIENNEESF